MLLGIKTTNRMQQLHDFNTVCYEKVIQQLQNGHQVSCFSNPASVNALVKSAFDGSLAGRILFSRD